MLIVVLDVMPHRFLPAPVGVGGKHVGAPHLVHPEHVRRPKGQAGNQAIDVEQRAEPVMNALDQRVAEDAFSGFARRSRRRAWRGPWRGNGVGTHGWPPFSCGSGCTSFGPYRK